MHSADLEVLQAAEAWLQAGSRVALVTVVRTFGSAPRQVGAMVALCEDGRLAGSVSGGCIEADLIERVRGNFPSRPDLLRYGVTREEAQRFGLPCGGTLELVWEPVAVGDLVPALRAVQERELIRRELDLESGKASFHASGGGAECGFDGRRLSRLFGPSWRMLVIGAGQIARYLAEMARALDYHVQVCDPREEYARSWTDASVTLDTGMPDDVVRALRPDARTVIVAVTHDPRLDDMALMEALQGDAFYVGALGAKANQLKRRERLLSLGLSPAQVDRLHGPVGLPLGGKTPPEIALAVLAEVTALRHGVTLAQETVVEPVRLQACG